MNNDIDQAALEIAREFVPVDVVGKQRANLQVAIIGAIKKYANPKTLADVQPGGRVRLGDQAHVTISDELLTRMAYSIPGAVDTTDKAKEVAARVVEIYLSAQPSPGGQDACAQFSQWWSQQSDDIANLYAYEIARLGWDGALAARQPVGEPVTVEAVATVRRDGEGDHYIDWLTEGGIADLEVGDVLMVSDRAITDEDGSGEVYAAPPAQQPAQVYLDGLDRALGEAIDQRDHYHEVADELAARIAAITGVDIGEHSSANCPWQNAIEAAEEYKPAQAVDLAPASIPDTPEVRDILGRPNFWCSPWANVLRKRGDVIPCKAEDEQAAVIRFMLNHYLAHGAGWAEAAEAELQAIRYQVTRND